MTRPTSCLFLIAMVAGSGCGMGNPAPATAPDAAADAAAGDAALPDPPDLRFKFVGAFPESSPQIWVGDPLGAIGTAPGFMWSPTAWEAVDSSFLFKGYIFGPPTMQPPATSILAGDTNDDIDAGLETAEHKYVLTSLAFTSAGWGYTGTAPSVGYLADSYDVVTHSSDTADELVDQVFRDADLGLITTAIGFDGTHIRYASYRLHGDTQTYLMTVRTGPPEDLAAMLQELGSRGEYITAFGQVDATNYAIVGTRISGATPPRSVAIAPDKAPDGSITAGELIAQGYVVVGAYFDASDTAQFLLEK